MKTNRDIESEYGWTLRWINGSGDEAGNITPWTFYLEKADGTRRTIIEPEALKYIDKVTVNSFRRNPFEYERYIQLFEILGISPRKSFGEVVKETGLSGYRLARSSKKRDCRDIVWRNYHIFRNR